MEKDSTDMREVGLVNPATSEENITVKVEHVAPGVQVVRLQHNMNKEELLQVRLRQFVETFANEVGEPAIGALIVVHWQKDLSQGIYLAVQSQFRKAVIKNIGNAFLKSIESIKARLSVTRVEQDADEEKTRR